MLIWFSCIQTSNYVLFVSAILFCHIHPNPNQSGQMSAFPEPGSAGYIHVYKRVFFSLHCRKYVFHWESFLNESAKSLHVIILDLINKCTKVNLYLISFSRVLKAIFNKLREIHTIFYYIMLSSCFSTGKHPLAQQRLS